MGGEPPGQQPEIEGVERSFTEEMRAAMDFVKSEQADNGAVVIGQGSKEAVILPVHVRKILPTTEASSEAVDVYAFITEHGVKELVFGMSAASNLSDKKLTDALAKIQEGGAVLADDAGYLPPNPELKNGREMLFFKQGLEFSNQPEHPSEGYIRDISDPTDLSKAIEASKARVKEMRRPERMAQQASLQAVRSIMPPN